MTGYGSSIQGARYSLDSDEGVHLNKGQTDILIAGHNEGLDVALYQGGLGSGKTTLGVTIGILLALTYPKSRGLVVAESYRLLQDTTRLRWDELLPLRYRRSWLKTPDNLVLKNGSEVWFRHLQDPERMKSTEFDWVHIEEASQISYESFQMIVGRVCRRNVVPQSRIFLTTNPEEAPGWIYDLFISPDKRLPNYRHVISPTTENPGLSQAYIRNLYDIHSAASAQIYIAGETGRGGSSRCYREFSRDVHTSRIDPVPTQPVCLAFDFNVDPMCAVMAQIEESTGVVKVFDEFMIRNSGTVELCRAIKDRYPLLTVNRGASVWVFGDASGNQRNTASAASNFKTDYEIIYSEFPGCRPAVERSNPTNHQRVEAVNARLRNAVGRVRFSIDQKCKNTILDLERVVWKEGAAWQIDKSDHNRTHLSDALGYLICKLFPIHRAGVSQSGGA